MIYAEGIVTYRTERGWLWKIYRKGALHITLKFYDTEPAAFEAARNHLNDYFVSTIQSHMEGVPQ